MFFKIIRCKAARNHRLLAFLLPDAAKGTKNSFCASGFMPTHKQLVS